MEIGLIAGIIFIFVFVYTNILLLGWGKVAPDKLLLFYLVVGLPLTYTAKITPNYPLNVGVSDMAVFAIGIYLLVKFFKGKTLNFPIVSLLCVFLWWVVLSYLIGMYKLKLEINDLTVYAELSKFLILYLYFYAVVNLLKDRQNLIFVTKTWLWISVIISLFGIAGSLLFTVFHISTSLAAGYRATGTFQNPNMFASYVSLSFYIGYLYYELTGRRHNFCYILFAILGMAVFFTASRGALIALFGGVFLLFLSRLHHWWLAKVSICLVSIALLTLVYVSANKIGMPQLTRLISITDVGSHDYEKRYSLWEPSIKLWEANYITGVGRGNFGRFDVASAEKKEKNRPRIHNTYLSLLCETGTIGLLLYLAIIGYFVLGAFLPIFSRGVQSENYFVFSILFCALITIIIH